ncbi:MAG: tetratricopeptide repeat protein, partial [Phycisphaerae bacterium]|nr:tetratricopeptide repeat protein [Phycisphaerae bacterium]
MSDWIDAEQHADRAATLLESGRLAEAEAAFRRALAIDSAQADWHFQLGLLLEM